MAVASFLLVRATLRHTALRALGAAGRLSFIGKPVQIITTPLPHIFAAHRSSPSGLPLPAFLDTEFTDLDTWPWLLSVGLVADHGRDQAYDSEVTDPERIETTHRFARGAVLPQFGRVADAATRRPAVAVCHAPGPAALALLAALGTMRQIAD